MSYTVIATSVKPATSKWFAQVNSSAAKAYDEWISKLPEVTSYSINKVDTNTVVKTYVVASESDWLKVSAQHDSHPVTLLRKAHNTAFNILTTLQAS